ncbi:MAG: FAD binding domain-containing protein [Spirochaetaceae bacterium]|jgi:CO/xanthine dehydrogenase FAD-binding subunit|nr:FAD binding domain-containing protein [Spirochaetaceae bacterium]
MAAPLNQVFFPATFQELFTAWSRFPDAVPFAGGTGLIRGQGKQSLELPRNILSLDKLEDLRRITRTERYLEIGAMVRLNEIIRLGKIVPEVLTRCLEHIAGPQIRNIATIGGNICYPERRLDASVPLVALDAHFELRNGQNSRWISASRFCSIPGPLAINPQELLTRIRIPLEQWNYSVFKKFKGSSGTDSGGVIVFIIRNQKNTLTDIRIVFGAERILRDKNSETLLIGNQLPLSRKEADDFVEHWKSYLAALDTPEAIIRSEILNFIESQVLFIVE